MDRRRNVLIRVGLWFVSFLIADFCFSFFFGVYSRQVSVAAAFFIYTLIYAAPAWCLYLPVVIAFKDAEGRRIWTILSIGILIGPLSLLFWGVVDRLNSVNAPGSELWESIEAVPGIFWVFAVVVGSLTTCAYVCSLKILHGRRMRAV